ncbi:hypothetical protein OPV22_000431 [Ensete ventricosum]|uniref:Uncharacterized protein n=1 Tax=Ensete ventricosum TaxID=4639 RepID=A0AAV8RN04_ENSVE|nr:hypothetical protein OPV22_000431 [Ensete ventricosum]
MGVVPSRTSSLSARTVSRDLGHLRSRGSPGSSDPFVRTASASLGVVTGTEDVAGAGRGHACKKAGEVLLPRHTAGGAVGTLSLSAHLLLPLSRSLFPLVSLEAQGFDSQCEASYSAVFRSVIQERSNLVLVASKYSTMTKRS